MKSKKGLLMPIPGEIVIDLEQWSELRAQWYRAMGASPVLSAPYVASESNSDPYAEIERFLGEGGASHFFPRATTEYDLRRWEIVSGDGDALDALAKKLGTYRKTDWASPWQTMLEPDDEFRERLLKIYDSEEKKAPEPKIERNPENPYGCECGAWTSGFRKHGPTHSTWCQLWRRE